MCPQANLAGRERQTHIPACVLAALGRLLSSRLEKLGLPCGLLRLHRDGFELLGASAHLLAAAARGVELGLEPCGVVSALRQLSARAEDLITDILEPGEESFERGVRAAHGRPT